MSDYTYWEQALQGNFLPIHDSEAFPGFYRKRTGRAAGYVPVAIWEQDGKTIALVDGKSADASAVWSYCADKPISEEHYRERMARGKWWDEDDAVTASLQPPPIGHNEAGEADTIKDQIEAALKAVEAYSTVSDDVSAAKAQSARSRLLELSRDADKQRETLKRPHFEAGKAVDELYQPLVKSSKAGADMIAKALSAHETRKANVAAEQRRKDEEAQRKAFEEAQAKAPIGVTVEPEPVPTPAVAPVATPIKGAYGRAASVKVVKIAPVKDQDAAYAHLKAQPELVSLIQSLAQKAITAGFSVPGVEVTEERKVS